MAFDEAFLVERRRKELDWISKGVKTGSGKPFKNPLSLSNGSFLTKKASKQQAGGVKKSVASNENHHAIALARLAKNPDLKNGNGEHWEQVRVFDFIKRYHPDFYDDFAAIPNGGLRAAKTAADLRSEGAKSGYPDIVCDYASGKYHGLFIELKVGKNKPSENQVALLNRKRQRGYFSALCYGFDDAKLVIQEYLSLQAGGAMTFNSNENLWLSND